MAKRFLSLDKSSKATSRMSAQRNRSRAADSSILQIRPLQPGDWRNIVKLFGDKGGCGGCWGMWPRMPHGGKIWEEAQGAKNPDRLRRVGRVGKGHGLLAFCGEEPGGRGSF